MKPVRVAIVGAGLMGRWHAHAAVKARGTVVAIVDIDQTAARRLSKRHRTAELFTSIDEMLVRNTPNVVHICSPISTHYSTACRTIDAGCHVLIEKPMTSAAAETEKLFESAATRGVYLSPVHQFLFQAGVLKARRLLPRIGQLVDVSAVISSAGGVGLPHDQLDALVADVLPHPLSLFQFFAPGQLQHISWTLARPAAGEFRVLGEASGLTFSIFISFSARPSANFLELRGTSGSIFINLFHGYSFFQSGAVSRTRKAVAPFHRSFKECAAAAVNLGSRLLEQEYAYPGLQRLVRLFYHAFQNNMASPISRADSIELARARDALMDRARPALERVAARS